MKSASVVYQCTSIIQPAVRASIEGLLLFLWDRAMWWRVLWSDIAWPAQTLSIVTKSAHYDGLLQCNWNDSLISLHVLHGMQKSDFLRTFMSLALLPYVRKSSLLRCIQEITQCLSLQTGPNTKQWSFRVWRLIKLLLSTNVNMCTSDNLDFLQTTGDYAVNTS